MANENGLDLYIFGFFSRIVLAKAAKVAKNILEIEIAVSKKKL